MRWPCHRYLTVHVSSRTATSSGFRVYFADPFAKSHETHDGNVSLLEMLFATSLIALVISPRRLIITNTKVSLHRDLEGHDCSFVRSSKADRGQRNSTICELTFPTAILSVKLNRKRMVVVLEHQIYLYDISNMKLVHTIGTSPNPHGNHH